METLNNILTQLHIGTATRAILIMIIGYAIARAISTSANTLLKKRLRPHPAMLAQRTIFYLIIILFLTSVIEELGFHISALLGATGIITVAIGIASQASISNFVSGIFIIGEKPFEVGDTIKVNEVQGEVLSIDFLSVKIRAADNTMVRIPNEVLIKSFITNLSYFPIRRVDLIVSIAYKEDFTRVKNILLEIAEKNSLCLDDPSPTVNIDNFGDSAVNLQFYCWANKENHNNLRNALRIEIKSAFEKNNVEMPYPCRTLFAGDSSTPLPVKIMNADDK